MPPYLRLGSIPRKRHIAHAHEPGFKDEGIYYEEVVTTAGFSAGYSIVYHLRPPTRVTHIEPAGTVTTEYVDEPCCGITTSKPARFPPRVTPSRARTIFFGNDDVACRAAGRQRRRQSCIATPRTTRWCSSIPAAEF